LISRLFDRSACYTPSSPRGVRFAFRARLLKLLLLLEHYGIKPGEPDCWLKLAFLLAQDHVPGMQVVENAPRERAHP